MGKKVVVMMNEAIRHLVEDCQNLKNDIDRQKAEYEEKVSENKGDTPDFKKVLFEDTKDGLINVNAILIPLEINIRRVELRLKRLKLELKESPEYQSFKTIKAKDEKVVLDTYDIAELILDLKLERNKLRSVSEYLTFTLKLLVKEED